MEIARSATAPVIHALGCSGHRGGSSRDCWPLLELRRKGDTHFSLEKNRKPGVKILMSGGTRCNITHDTDRRGIIEAFGKPGRFLHSALAALGPRELVALIEAEGVATKVEEHRQDLSGQQQSHRCARRSAADDCGAVERRSH